jgi:CheY-like chemotaxis protein/anti-sigma regulatory factor (Ser/Thr protein kinase)
MGSGRLQLDCRPVDLHWLVEGATERARVQAEAKGLRLHVSLDGEVPRRIVADPLRLEQVLRNLLDNAVKFTEQGSVSLAVETLELDERSATLRFSVVDTGIGIPKEKRDLIFQSFAQADGSTTRTHRGTGLGTTIAQRLVQLMGGDIGVESEPGEGSAFFFTLTFETADPVSPGQAEAGEKPAPGTARKHPPTGKVLVADDYPTNQQVARCHLESAGHTVRVVGTGEQAVAAFQEDAFDLVLMDVQMPNLDGYQATRQIRRLGPSGAEIPILAMTTPATSAARRACREAGMDDIVVKPLNRERFLAVVADWLAMPRKVDSPAPANPSPSEEPVETMP